MPETTDDPTSEELRVARAKILLLLNHPELTAGPWLSLDDGDRVLRDQPGDEDNPPIYVINEPMSNAANSRWIELMNPATGPHIAAILHGALTGRLAAVQAAADVWPDDPTARHDFVEQQTNAPAVALARLINDRP